MNSGNNGFEFLDLVTVAAYLMSVDNITQGIKNREETEDRFNKLEKKIDKILKILEKE